MDFSSLWKIVNESVEMKASQFAINIQHAFRSIFDLDNSDLKELKFGDLAPPNHMHNYLFTNISFTYNQNLYKVYLKVYHYQSKVNRSKFLDTTPNAPREKLTYDMLKNPPENLKIVAGIYKLFPGEPDDWGLPPRDDLGRIVFSKPIGEIVQSIKNIIDSPPPDDDNDNDVPVEPEPIVPSSKKPVLV